jgi:hypothetical protein
LKFLRQLARVVSLVAILLLAAQTIAAQPRKASQQPRNQASDAADATRGENERNVKMLADELRAIREEAAQRERERTAREQEQRSLFFGNDAIVWSDWVLAGIALFAGVIATRAFNHERDAVRSTEEARVALRFPALGLKRRKRSS